jgi:hypothetical protein
MLFVVLFLKKKIHIRFVFSAAIDLIIFWVCLS